MKKLCIWFTLILILFMFTSASAATETSHKSTGGFGTGKFAIGGNLGYSIGFGDAFKEYSGYGYKFKNKLGISFGAKFKYKINPKFSLGGILEYQGGSSDWETPGGWGGSYDDSYHFTNLLASAIYNLKPQQKNSFYLAGGLGLYMDGDTNLGIHMGGGMEHFFQPDLSLDAGARFHVIFTSGETTTYINIYAGVNYYFGGK
jgi:hypothetical protein